MEAAFQKGEALLEDIRSSDGGDRHFHLWWLGQSGFLVKWRGEQLLFDPYLSDSLTRKYAGTGKPHVRVTERVAAPGELVGVGVATSSHNHTDHLDAETLLALAGANPDLRLVLPAANIDFAADRLGDDSGIELIGVDESTAAAVGAFEIAAVAAAHNEVERDAAGRPRFVGFVARFGPWAVYHSGDTLWHPHLVPSLLPHAVDVAIVPINGNDPARGVAGNLNGTEAAALAKAIGARVAIPHHFDMFEFNTADPDEFVAACARLGQPCRVLRNGEGWCSAELA